MYSSCKRNRDGQSRETPSRIDTTASSLVRFLQLVCLDNNVIFQITYDEGATAIAGRVATKFRVVRPNMTRSMAFKAQLSVKSYVGQSQTYTVEDGVLRAPAPLASPGDRLALVGGTVARCVYQALDNTYAVEGVDDGAYPVAFLKEHLVAFESNEKRFAELEKLGSTPLTLQITENSMSYCFYNGRVGCRRSFAFTDVNLDHIELKWEEWQFACALDAKILRDTLASIKCEKINNIAIRLLMKPNCDGVSESKESKESLEGQQQIEEQALHFVPREEPGVTTTFTSNYIDCSIIRRASDSGGDTFEVYNRDRYSEGDESTADYEDAHDWEAFIKWTQELTKEAYAATFDMAMIYDVVDRIYRTDKNSQIQISLPGETSKYDFIVISSRRPGLDPYEDESAFAAMLAPKQDHSEG